MVLTSLETNFLPVSDWEIDVSFLDSKGRSELLLDFAMVVLVHNFISFIIKNRPGTDKIHL